MATTRIESSNVPNTNRTWKEEFEGITKTGDAYEKLLEKFARYVGKQESFGQVQTKQFESELKSLGDISEHWDEVNEKIEDSIQDLDIFGNTAEDIRRTFESIVVEASSIGQQVSRQRSVMAKISDLAGAINRSYSVEGQFQQRNLDRLVQRSGMVKDEFLFRTKMITGGNLDKEALQKALELNKEKTSELERQYNLAKMRGARSSELELLKKQIVCEQQKAEYLNEGNIKLVERLELLAKINKQNRRDVIQDNGRVQRTAGLTGKIAGILGLSDVQDQIKDIKEDFLQKAAANRSTLQQAGTNRLNLERNVNSVDQDLTNTLSEAAAKNPEISNKFETYKSLEDQIQTRSKENKKKGIKDIDDKDLQSLIKKQNQLKASDSVLGSIVGKLEALNKLKAELVESSEQEKEAEKAVKEEANLAAKASGDMAKCLWDSVKSGQALAVALGAAVWKAFAKVDELGVKLQREIGTWAGAIASANSELISATDFLEQAYQISTQFHIDPISIFTPVELAKAAEFKNMSNLSAQEVATLAVRSKSVNQSVTAYNTSMKEGYNNVLKSTTSAVAFGSVQKEIANTSEAISLSLGDNPKKIAEAATAALSLGMSMKDIEGIAENLMNFESSIEHEMEAQLLTGKQMNLAKAREYALNNDIAGLSRELRNNGVDAVEFQGMSYIKQKSLAQALGMSRDQLAGMVRQQILGANATDEWKKKTLGLTDEEYKRASAQEQWQKVREKFLQSLTPLLKPVLDILTAVVGVLRWITGGIGMIISYFQPVFDFFQKIHSWLQKLFADSDSKVVRIVKNVSKAGTGIVGMILTVSVAAGTLIKSFQAAKSAILGGAKAIYTAFTGAKTVIAGTGTAMGNLEKAFRGGSHSPEVYQRARRIKALQKSEASTVAQSASGATGKGLGGVSKGVKGFSATKVLAGAAAMVLVAGALWILSKAMQEMQKVTEGTAYVNVVLGLGVLMGAVWGLGMIAKKATDKIAVAALAMALIGASLIPLAFALNLMKGVDWNIGKTMALSIAAFFAEFMLIGAALIGPQAALLGIGVAAIVSIGAAMTTLGIGLKKLKAATADLDVKDLKSKIDGIADIFVSLGDKDFDLKSIRKFRRASRQLSKIGKSLSSVASIENISGITALTQALAKFVSVLDKLDVQKFNKLSKSKISAVARVGVESESVTGSYNAAVDTKAASEVRVERQQTAQKAVKLDVIESKMDTIIKAIVNSRPGWDWLKFDEEAAKSLPNWQRS